MADDIKQTFNQRWSKNYNEAKNAKSDSDIEGVKNGKWYVII